MTAPPGINPWDPQTIQELPWRSDYVRRTFAPATSMLSGCAPCVELVVHGEVVAATDGPGRVEVEYRLIPEAGCWVAARAVGSNRTVAHSAPVYVTVGGAKHTWHAQSVPAIVDRMEALLRDLVESTPDPFLEDFEAWDLEAS